MPRFDSFDRFNPIANTFMKKAIQGMVDRHFDSNVKMKPSKSLIESIVESSEGDIRSALMALQFTTFAPSRGKKGGSTS
jgi:cell cycle checkpoint protein